MAVKFEKVGDHDYMLDVTGYVCPHPQMYTKKVMGKLESGDVLTLLFDNPSSGESIVAMCESEGNELIERTNENGASKCVIRKA
ncbi:sulfurtransferase TusA family protein [Thiohalobacter thiocyanaticus]|uniref:Sulfurtransferase TusA family protein n=1 Tax=Thiohalobacter thiocyanaticus TaxID=585455 RepID=A0A426QK53_9GAMM|nr:sulfurtransferase TusA family protein [Thiohalobacter thiocyanaticus]RRQ22128.1 sulfurtransferase TusA family protein [Thiohalobacter thiocyanaticus]